MFGLHENRPPILKKRFKHFPSIDAGVGIVNINLQEKNAGIESGVFSF